MDTDDAALRARVERLLNGGLVTRCTKRAYDSAAVNAVVAALGCLPRGDLNGRLVTAGLTLQPWPTPDDDLEQSCSTCMYFESHRRFCALPELQLPVEPRWSCVLWRI
ncbi:MAG TPA: hypothetical protein VLI72_15115 [Methylibium sp.]|nr:hypothetical protein [Methylibium sp.]